MGKFICGVDLGGTKIGVGIVDEYGNVLSSIKVPTNRESSSEEIIDKISECIETVLKEINMGSGDLSAIGIGVPGSINADKGEVIYLVNIPGWFNVPIVNILNNKFKVPVKLDNDANAAAYGEYLFGSGKGIKNFVYMTISTGIGGGVIINGKLYRGANNNAGELGHTIIDINGPGCNCGNFGCFEALASGEAIARFAQQYIEAGEVSIIKKLSGNKTIKAEHVFEAAKAGDRLALKIVDMEALYIGVGISNIIAFYDPEVIAIGGGVSNQWDVIKDKVIQTVRERALKSSREKCKIIKAKLGVDIGILGAAALTIE